MSSFSLSDIKTPSDLKYYYKLTYPGGLYFDYKTMKFFGDTMKNFSIKHLDRGTENHRILLSRKNETSEGYQRGAMSIWFIECDKLRHKPATTAED